MSDCARVGVDIESSDSLGNKKDTFDLSDTVYVYGSNYSIDQDYTIYVVVDTSWTDGMAIPAQPSMAPTVTSDASGDIPVTPVWTSPLTPGKYDIVIDVNGNSVYDDGVDALDDNDIQVTAGFFVIPEYLFGTILALIGCFAAFGIFRFKRTKYLSWGTSNNLFWLLSTEIFSYGKISFLYVINDNDPPIAGKKYTFSIHSP